MPSRSGRILRRLFRWICRLVVLMVLGLLVAGVYLEKAGVPEFVKRRLVDEIRARGWEVEFSRLRFHWYRGIVAENVVLKRYGQRPGPVIFVDEAACQVNRRQLRHLGFQPEAVTLRGGRIVWQLRETNQPTATVQLDRVGGELYFKSNDVWDLRSLRAEILGTSVQIAGTLTNASVVRDWRFPKTSGTAASTQALWRRIVAAAGRVKFTGQPQLVTHFDADARTFETLDAEFKFLAEAVETPWGGGTNAVLRVRVYPARLSQPLQADLELTAEDPETEWCRARKLRMNWQIEAPFTTLLPSDTDIAIELLDPETPWARARRAVSSVHVFPKLPQSSEMVSEVQATLDHLQSDWGRADHSQLILTLLTSGTNLIPAGTSGELRSTKAQTRWGDAASAAIGFKVTMLTNRPVALFETNVAWPKRLEGIDLDVTIRASNLVSAAYEVEKAAVDGHWRNDHLQFASTFTLYGGVFAATGAVETTTRELTFAADSKFDLQPLFPWFTPKTQAWFSNYTWRTAPEVHATGRMILPAWTNQHPDWLSDVRPTISLAGNLKVNEGTFRDVPFSAASSTFFLTNLAWHLPDLRVQRPEGEVLADYRSDLGTRDFHWRVHSVMDPKAVRPLLEDEMQQRGLDYFQFTQPPEIEAEIWNRWGDVDRLGIVAQIRATNCSFRGQAVSAFTTGLTYTNKLLAFLQPHIWQGPREGQAPQVLIDFITEKIFFTNGFGNLDPMSVAQAISPKSAEAIEPYRFDLPPVTRVNGTVDLKKGRHDDNLHFQVKGGPFRWRQFRLQSLGGNIDWVGDKLSLNNMRGEFRDGTLGGAAAFDFTRGQGANFAFNIGVSEADLRTFMPDIGYPTNRLEGVLNGELFVRSARTTDPKSWQGEGKVQMRDGLLWDIPMFGALSSALNAIAPGLGNSRAKQATGSYVITNSVIVSHDLEIRATAMRMNFSGNVDFDGKMDSRVEAVLLRDVPAFGWLFSKLLWPITKIFEYRVTGTLGHPKMEPLYIVPKILLMPFHPIKTLKEMAPEEGKPVGKP